MLRKILVLSILISLLTGCAAQAQTTSPAPTTLTVLAAASLAEPFAEIGKKFEQQHAQISVEFSFAGSQQLVQQLSAGVPADVFASASPKSMQDAQDAGRIQTGNLHIFATNRLVVISPASNPAGLKSAQDLERPNIKVVLAAKEVPAGQYALEFFDKASQAAFFGTTYKEKVLKNVVSYENNVKAVLTKVTLGEADGGIVYATDAASAGDKVIVFPIDDPINVTARYPVAVIQDSKNAKLAQEFITFLQSSTGQEILAKYGFQPGQ